MLRLRNAIRFSYKRGDASGRIKNYWGGSTPHSSYEKRRERAISKNTSENETSDWESGIATGKGRRRGESAPFTSFKAV